MTTTAAEPGKTVTKTSSKPSPSASRAKKRKPARRAAAKARLAAKRPVTLEGARQEMQRLICVNSAAITQALIDLALQGNQLPAKFLFEVAGLSETKGDEMEDAAQRETLASYLLTRWQVETGDGTKPALDGQSQNGSAPDGQVTEVVEVTTDSAGLAQPPVEL